MPHGRQGVTSRAHLGQSFGRCLEEAFGPAASFGSCIAQRRLHKSTLFHSLKGGVHGTEGEGALAGELVRTMRVIRQARSDSRTLVILNNTEEIIQVKIMP